MTRARIEGTRGYGKFVSAVADSMGLGETIHRPGTSVVAAEDRSGSSMVVTYSISAHTVVWCDPALADDLFNLADSSTAKSLDEIGAWADRMGWARVSVNHMQLLRSSGLVRPEGRASVVIRSLDSQSPPDVALIDAFKAALSDDDREEADLDTDQLDEHILAVVDDHGIAAFASQQPFLYADGFGDIAVATRADVRGGGLGRIVVAALCDEIERRDLFALYRCDLQNHGSVRLSAGLGFVPAVKILACKRP